jgi:hypothetical protein
MQRSKHFQSIKAWHNEGHLEEASFFIRGMGLKTKNEFIIFECSKPFFVLCLVLGVAFSSMIPGMGLKT